MTNLYTYNSLSQERTNAFKKYFVSVSSEITTKSLTQSCLLKGYVSLLSQEHFQNYCKVYNYQSNILIKWLQYQSLGYNNGKVWYKTRKQC